MLQTQFIISSHIQANIPILIRQETLGLTSKIRITNNYKHTNDIIAVTIHPLEGTTLTISLNSHNITFRTQQFNTNNPNSLQDIITFIQNHI